MKGKVDPVTGKIVQQDPDTDEVCPRCQCDLTIVHRWKTCPRCGPICKVGFPVPKPKPSNYEDDRARDRRIGRKPS